MSFDWRTVKISDQARSDATRLGLTGDLEAKLKDMLRVSTPFTHQVANRRFNTVMLTVTEGVLQSIAPIDIDPRRLRRANRRPRRGNDQDEDFLDLTK
jgi:hypothetical protein